MKKLLTIFFYISLVLCFCITGNTYAGKGWAGRIVVSGGSAPDPLDPIAWWKMTDTGTNTTQILDFSDIGHSGTGSYAASNKPTVATGPTLTLTNSPAFYTFDGADYFYITDNAVFTPTNMSISAWVYLPAHNADYKQILAKAVGSGTYEWWLSVYANNDGSAPSALVMTMTDPTFANFFCRIDSVAFPVAQWVHVVSTWAGSTNIYIYRNAIDANGGKLSGGTFAGISDTTAPVSIGSWGTPANYWSGSIDDVRYYTRVLSNTEITNLYVGGRQ